MNEDDIYDDPEYRAWLAECADECVCCPECAPESPCAGVFAGGLCDLFDCRCHERDCGPDDDEIEEEMIADMLEITRRALQPRKR